MVTDRMISSRHRVANIILVIGLILIGPFITSPHASAQSAMDHNDMQTNLSCFSGCTNSQGTVLQQNAILLQDEKHSPAPPPKGTDFTQPRNIMFPQSPRPKNLITSSSFVPPDINVLHSIFRI